MLKITDIDNRTMLKRLATLLGVAVTGLGCLALIGWSTGLRILASIRSDYVPMSCDTAVLLMACGIYLVFAQRQPANPEDWRDLASRAGGDQRNMGISVACFSLVGLYGLLNFIVYILGFDYTLENYLFPHMEKLNDIPVGIMSPYVGALFFLSAFALVLSLLAKGRLKFLNAVGCLGVVVSMVGFVATLGYLYEAPFLYGGNTIPLAATTALAFLLLGLGLVALSTEKSIILRRFSGDEPISQLLRSILPMVVLAIVFTYFFNYKIAAIAQINPVVLSPLLILLFVLVITMAMARVASALSRHIDMKESQRMALERQVSDAFEFDQKILTASTIGVKVYKSSGQCIFANEAMAQMIGARVDQLITQNFNNLKAWQEGGMLKAAQRALSEGKRQQMEGDFVSSFGKYSCLDFQFIPFQTKGEKQLLVLAIDITERKKGEVALASSELNYRRLFESSEDGILLINAATGLVEDVNPFLVNLLGYSSKEYLGKYLWDFGFWGDATKGREAFKKLQETGYVRYENLPLKTADGKEIQVELVSNVYQVGERKVIQCNIRDITQRRKLEINLEYLAHYDVLTGLPNRALFFALANAGLAQSKRDHKCCAVLIVDLDNSKSINDTMGHSMVDELIKDAAIKLKECVRERDTVAHLEGDEFIVFMGDLDNHESARFVAERIRAKFDGSRQIQGKDIFITASIGIAIFPDDGDDLGELLRNSDTAMYVAKEEGKNAYRFFNSEMNRLAVKKVWIERGLRQALVNGSFRLYYQPIISLETGKIRGFEALLRWFPPGGELIYPDEFIPAAESTGLIVPIGEWVLHEACRFNKKLIDAGWGRPVVSVNVSVEQLKRKDFPDVISAALKNSGIPAECLEIEITESLMIKSLDNAITILNAIRSLGVQVSLDDFGTGYSSLGHLRQLPIGYVKIDRFFINEIGKETKGSIMIPSIINMAHKLKLSVVAEGVETELQLRNLTKDGCDYFQGYLFSKAVPEDQAMVLYLKGITKI